MPLFIGILGLPNVGKSTLFNALTKGRAEASNYPFCTVEPNVGVVEVPDERLERLSGILQPTSITPTAIRFVDIAGLVRGASRGEGLGNQFLGHVREADALVHVVRCFEDAQVAHVDGSVDPRRDIATIETELLLADLDSLEKALPHLEKVVQSEPRSTRRLELDVVRKVRAALERGQPVRALGLEREQSEAVRSYNLLTAKPVLYAANVSEAEVVGGNAWVEQLAAEVGAGQVLTISAQIEAELAQLTGAEQGEFLAELGLEEGGAARMVRAGYRLLGLITFYTHAHGKLQAWQLPQGTLAPRAAGRIHTDMEQGFIRAEVAAYEDLIACHTLQRLREEGRLRTEGRDYAIADGDVVHFLFKV